MGVAERGLNPDYRLLVIYDIKKTRIYNWKENEMNESIVLNVSGMKCGGCESNVTGKLEAVDGVLSVKASHKENEVIVEFDAEKTDVDAIKEVITGAGFTVTD